MGVGHSRSWIEEYTNIYGRKHSYGKSLTQHYYSLLFLSPLDADVHGSNFQTTSFIYDVSGGRRLVRTDLLKSDFVDYHFTSAK